MFQAVNPGLQDPRLQALSDLKAVAQGGFAQVFRARWGDNPVALKLQALSSEELKQRFRREVHALSQLENPFIVRIHAAGDYQGWGWLILEWCEGPTLRSLVDEASARGDFVAEDWLFQRFTELAEALQAVHALGLVHRDVKPENIVISGYGTEEEKAVLVDFGLVGMDRFEGAKSLTKTGGIIGTLDYASPEQLEAKGEFGRTSEATDVWGWAVTLAFALTGESPFARDNSLETAAAILNSDWSFENQSKRSRKAQALVQMGLRRDPEERESFAEILAALASDPPQSSLRFSFSWIFVVLLLLASILIFSVSGLLREPPRLLEIEPFPERSNARECRIRGRLSKPGLTLNLGSKTATSDSEGRFEFLMTLNEGKNGWSLRYGETTLKTIKIEVDRAPPRIAMDAQSEGGPLDWPEGGILRGQVSATSKVQLWLGDQAVEVEANGSFSLTPAPRARAQMIRLEASDSLNQRTQLEFTLSSPLDDRRRWNELSIEQQNELIREVEKSLGKQFSWLETKTYKTEALSFRIATFEHRQSGIKMNLIPGGTITIGTSDPAPLRSIFESDYTAWRLWAKQTYGWDYPAEIPKEWIESPTPARKISMRAFLVSATETDQGQWDSLRGSDSRINRGSDYPIEGVSIRDIRLWILKLDSELRLPSEVEWEYACRGGDEGHFGFGNNPEELKDYAACWRNRLPSSAPVARRKPNAFGLYDMHGNVWEWCEDNWHKSYEGAPKDASPWMSSDAEEGRLNVRRGGSFLYSAMELRSAARSANKSDDRSFYIGFRLVKSLD